MKPKASKSWSCGRCGKTFLHTPHGRKAAEKCCACVDCGLTTFMKYFGVSTYRCGRCSLKESLVSAIRHKTGVEDTFDRIRAEAGLVGLVLDYDDVGTPFLREQSEEDAKPARILGVHRQRLAANADERAFAEKWEKEQKCGLLATLLNPEGSTNYANPSPRDHLVAATVVQWLGSTVGQSFLESLGYLKFTRRPS